MEQELNNQVQLPTVLDIQVALEWMQCVWQMLILWINANGDCSLMDNSQMSNLLNQSRLKVLKARDDMIVVSGHPLHHTRCTGLHSHRKYCSKYPYFEQKKYVLQCLLTSGLRFAFWCVLQPLAKSDTFLPAGGASAQTETGLSCPRFLQLFSCSLLLRGTHSGCMYLDGWKVKWFAFMFF